MTKQFIICKFWRKNYWKLYAATCSKRVRWSISARLCRCQPKTMKSCCQRAVDTSRTVWNGIVHELKHITHIYSVRYDHRLYASTQYVNTVFYSNLLNIILIQTIIVLPWYIRTSCGCCNRFLQPGNSPDMFLWI